MPLAERDVLKTSLSVLRSVFKEWVNVERRTSGLFKNMGGHWVRVGKISEADIGGWVIRGRYATKPIAIEVKREDFRPTHIYKKDKVRFLKQCEYLQKINDKGGVGFWINNPSSLYAILTHTLVHGAKISFDEHQHVIVTRADQLK